MTKIAAGAVTTDKLANGSITTGKIADDAVTPIKLDRTYREIFTPIPTIHQHTVQDGSAAWTHGFTTFTDMSVFMFVPLPANAVYDLEIRGFVVVFPSSSVGGEIRVIARDEAVTTIGVSDIFTPSSNDRSTVRPSVTVLGRSDETIELVLEGRVTSGSMLLYARGLYVVARPRR